MNLDKLTSFAISVVLTAALLGNLDRLQLWVIKSQAKLLYESRASAWGSPSVFK
jgi:hypothetical protein